MITKIRECSRYGRFCNVLGELVGETPTRYIYGLRGGATAFVSKRSPASHRFVQGVPTGLMTRIAPGSSTAAA